MSDADFARGVQAGIDALDSYFRNEDGWIMVGYGTDEVGDPIPFELLAEEDVESFKRGALDEALRQEGLVL